MIRVKADRGDRGSKATNPLSNPKIRRTTFNPKIVCLRYEKVDETAYYILLETGDKLLLENGDKILMEY